MKHQHAGSTCRGSTSDTTVGVGCENDSSVLSVLTDGVSSEKDEPVGKLLGIVRVSRCVDTPFDSMPNSRLRSLPSLLLMLNRRRLWEVLNLWLCLAFATTFLNCGCVIVFMMNVVSFR